MSDTPVIIEWDGLMISELALKMSDLHQKSLDTSHFTSFLGDELLSAYFQTLLVFSDIVLLAYLNNSVVGYIIAGRRLNIGVDMFIRNHSLGILLRLFRNIQFFPSKLYQLFLKLTKTSRFSSQGFRLFSICVDPSIQRQGLGSNLLTHFERKLCTFGFTGYGLSVKHANSRAINFYVRNGFTTEFCTNNSIFYTKTL